MEKNELSLMLDLPRVMSDAPWGSVPHSFAVDLLQFCATQKPLVRSKLRGGTIESINEWTRRHGLHCVNDDEGYFFVAKSLDIAIQGRELDLATTPHEYEFGRLLGYPSCCAEFVSVATESRIDALADEIASWEFDGRFQAINPTGYRNGDSLICHLPCSQTCVASLELALAALECLRMNRTRLFPFDRWGMWLEE